MNDEMMLPDGRSYIALCREYLETEQRMLREAQMNAEMYPTPSRLAKALRVEVPVLLEIMEFAKTELGEYEADRIAATASGFLTEDGLPLPGETGMFI